MSRPPVRPIDCHQEPVAAARHLASCFDAGGRLVIHAPRHADHAHHVAVEFMHPVVAGTVALPAMVGSPSSGSNGDDVVMVIGELSDINDGDFSDSSDGDSSDYVAVDLHIPAVDDGQIMTAYHLLWELVQLVRATAAEPDGDSTAFLYPFLDGDVGGESNGGSDDSVEHLRASAEAKASESRLVSRAALDANRESLAAAATVIAAAISRGGRVLTMGNGGSACDAARAVRLLGAGGIPAQSLAADYAITTALANDLGAERIFARQIEALGRPGDVVVGFSTSGTSGNLLFAFDQAARIGMTTVGFAGYDGTGFVEHPTVEHTLAVASQSVHRIQEAQAALLDALIDAVGELRRPQDQTPAGAVS